MTKHTRTQIDTENTSVLARSIEEDLFKKYGPMLTGESLREVLGYPSMEAMRQAVSRGTIPVPVFPIKNRRGKFALAKDIAIWIAEQRININKPISNEILGGES